MWYDLLCWLLNVVNPESNLQVLFKKVCMSECVMEDNMHVAYDEFEQFFQQVAIKYASTCPPLLCLAWHGSISLYDALTSRNLQNYLGYLKSRVSQTVMQQSLGYGHVYNVSYYSNGWSLLDCHSACIEQSDDSREIWILCKGPPYPRLFPSGPIFSCIVSPLRSHSRFIIIRPWIEVPVCPQTGSVSRASWMHSRKMVGTLVAWNFKGGKPWKRPRLKTRMRRACLVCLAQTQRYTFLQT